MSALARGYSDAWRASWLIGRFRRPALAGAWPTMGYGLLCFLSSLLLTGYQVYSSNQALQIPLVLWLNDPSLYPGDPFAATLPYYASLLWRFVALLTRLVPLEPLLLVGFLVERLLVLGAAAFFARGIAPGSRLAPIGAMALFALEPRPILGGGTIILPYFEQTGLSVLFFLVAAACFYTWQPWLSALSLAVGFQLNSMYGVYALTYLGAALLADPTYRRAWRTWTAAFGLFLLVAAPAVLLTQSAFSREVADSQQWLTAARARFPHHLNPLDWHRMYFAQFGFVTCLFLFVLARSRSGMSKLFRHGLAWTAVSIGWLAYAFFAAYVAESPAMLVMHPARGTDLWYCFAGLALLASLAQRVEDRAPGYRQAFAATGFAGAVVLWFALSKPNALGLLIIALTLAVVWGTTSRGRGVTHLPVLLMLCVVSLGVQEFYQRSRGFRNPEAALVSRPNSDLQAIATWARRSTAPEAVFAVPPSVAWSHFRSLAQRPIFVSWKDGSAILWDRPFVRAWWERLDALGMDLAEEMEPDSYANSLNRRYQRLTDQQLIGLRDRFSVRYWVVESGRQSRFRNVFQTRSYQVLEVGAPTNSSPGH